MPDYTETAAVEALSGKEVRDLYEDLRGANATRNDEYRALRDVYEGEHWDGVNLVADPERYSITANYARQMTDKAVEDLVGKMPGIQVVPPAADADGRAQAELEEALLYSTWARNRMERVLRQVAHNQILLRRGYLTYWWDPGAKVVRYKSLAPENVYPVLDGDDVVEMVVVSTRLTRGLKARYPHLASQITADVEGDDVSFQEDSARRASTTSGLLAYTRVIDWYDCHGNWVRCMGDATHTQKLGYDADHPPVIEVPNVVIGEALEPHGQIDDIIELNRYLDQLYSQQADIIAKYSNPPVVDEGSGQSPQAIRASVRSREGSVIPVKKGAKLSYLNWEGTLPEIGAQIDRTERYIQDLGGQPASAFGQTVTNQSGVMTNLSLTPTVKATQARETLMGEALVVLHADTLRIYEKFLKGEKVGISGIRFGRTPYQRKAYSHVVTGADIGGWYENRIKWPSALRIDDPVYVQTELSKMQSNPPAQSVYDTVENLGVEDVEAHMDRVAAQLEDPRFHPDRMEAAVNAAGALGDMELPTDLEGLAVPPAGDLLGAAEAYGAPNQEALANGSGA